MPRDGSQDAPHLQEARRRTGDHETPGILLADDDPIVLILTRKLLSQLGYTVFSATDGRNAVEVFQQQQDRISCVMIDLVMPHLNGWEALAAIRKLKPGLPAILSSGNDEQDVMSVPHSEMPQVYLQKPYNLAELEGALAKVFGSA